VGRPQVQKRLKRQRQPGLGRTAHAAFDHPNDGTRGGGRYVGSGTN
jgi:hypothetical protein